jgi:2-desacetyl-2-hydroxyethyl bacteriochlorophyllide A dehydrogenase
MKAALFEGPHRLTVKEHRVRPLRPDELLLRVSACGVCGTDVHIVEGNSRSTPPVVLGHEYFGIVEETGTSITNVTRGDLVAVDPNISCGACFYCLRGLVHLCENLKAYGVDMDGGMAEQSVVRASQVHRLPNGMTPAVGAFIEPVSCCVHGIEQADIAVGDTVVLFGGGTIGLILLQLAIAAGASRTIIVEPIQEKRQIAHKLGADVVLNPAHENVRDAVFDLTRVGADVVFECAGRTDTARQSLSLTRRGGTVVFFGVCPIGQTIDIEPNMIYFKEITLVGSYVNPHTFARAIKVLEQGRVKIDPFNVDRFPLEAVHQALEAQRTGKTIKSMIVPNEFIL